MCSLEREHRFEPEEVTDSGCGHNAEQAGWQVLPGGQVTAPEKEVQESWVRPASTGTSCPMVNGSVAHCELAPESRLEVPTVLDGTVVDSDVLDPCITPQRQAEQLCQASCALWYTGKRQFFLSPQSVDQDLVSRSCSDSERFRLDHCHVPIS